MIKKLMIKLAMRVMCFQLKRKAGLGKPFQHVLDTKNITELFNVEKLMFLPVYIHVNVKEDKYYFTHNGILVGFGNLDRLDPVTIIKKDCIEYGVLYQYLAAYATGSSYTIDKIFSDKVLYDYLIKELLNLALLKEKAA